MSVIHYIDENLMSLMMILFVFSYTYRKKLRILDRFKDIEAHLHIIVPLSIIFAKFDLLPIIVSISNMAKPEKTQSFSENNTFKFHCNNMAKK